MMQRIVIIIALCTYASCGVCENLIVNGHFEFGNTNFLPESCTAAVEFD